MPLDFNGRSFSQLTIIHELSFDSFPHVPVLLQDGEFIKRKPACFTTLERRSG